MATKKPGGIKPNRAKGPSRKPIATQVAALLCGGDTLISVSKKMKMGREKAAKVIASDEVREEVDRINREARKAAQQRGVSLVAKVATVWEDAMGATTGDVCKECGAPMADHPVRLKAAEAVADRFGLPKTSIQEIAAAAPLADQSDEELERSIVEEAASIYDRRGRHALAAAIRRGELPLAEAV